MSKNAKKINVNMTIKIKLMTLLCSIKYHILIFHFQTIFTYEDIN